MKISITGPASRGTQAERLTQTRLTDCAGSPTGSPVSERGPDASGLPGRGSGEPPKQALG